MPDITMCINSDCPKRLQCYRAMAQPNPYQQSYALLQPDLSGQCKDLILMDDKNVRS